MYQKAFGFKPSAIYNPLTLKPGPRSDGQQKKFLAVGRFSPMHKGFDLLIQAFALFAQKNQDWQLDIVGDGDEYYKLVDYIRRNDLNNKVTLHGFRDKKYIDSLMNNSSIYLMTSYTESFGIVLIEAMSHGLPCIAMDSAEGAREIINSGYNGYLIRNRNYEMMVRKIADLIDDKDIRKRLGKNARDSISKYTSDVVGEEWFTLIEESGVYE